MTWSGLCGIGERPCVLTDANRGLVGRSGKRAGDMFDEVTETDGRMIPEFSDTERGCETGGRDDD